MTKLLTDAFSGDISTILKPFGLTGLERVELFEEIGKFRYALDRYFGLGSKLEVGVYDIILSRPSSRCFYGTNSNFMGIRVTGIYDIDVNSPEFVARDHLRKVLGSLKIEKDEINRFVGSLPEIEDL